VEFHCKDFANLSAPKFFTPFPAQEENKPSDHCHYTTTSQPVSPHCSLPLLFYPLSCLFSLLLLYLRGYVPCKCNEVRVEFCCKASANLAAPDSPTSLSAQEENKPPGHRRPLPHNHQSTSVAPHCSLSLLSTCSLASILFCCSTSMATYNPSAMR